MHKAFAMDRNDSGEANAHQFASAQPSGSCAICNSAISRWRSKTTTEGTFPIDKCLACDYAFVNPRPSLDYLMQFYTTSGHRRDIAEAGATLEAVLQSERDFPHSILDAQRIIGTIRTLLPKRDTERGALLDVGCGYGFLSREATAAGFAVTAVELAAAERAIASSIASVDPINVSFEQFDAPLASYSAILMSQILEHALDVRGWLVRAHELLHEGGIIAIALPNFGSLIRRVLQDNDPFVTPPAHLNYFNHRNLSLLLSSCGFSVQRVQFVTRIPPAALERRFGRLGSPVAAGVAGVCARAMDLAHVGMMVSVFASKNGGARHLGK